MVTPISNRPSVLALKEESTEGAVTPPSATTDYTALQEDFSMALERDTLENPEVKPSLGPSKPIQGIENPNGSLTHLFRHSGTEGVAPDYNLLIKAAFGSETVNGTEETTTSGSTTTVIEGAGSGDTPIRGQALLIKDAANGYSIRPALSISSNSYTIGFPVGTAPASGVDLGDAVTWSPAESGHPSLSVWHYVGNGGAIQLITGTRVVSMSATFTAGDIINSSYSFEGIRGYFDPITIDATNDGLDFIDEGNSESVQVTHGTYHPHALADAIQSAMQADATSNITVTYDDATGKYTIASDGSISFQLPWLGGSQTATTIGSTIGFVIADDTGAFTYTSDNAIDLSAPHTPSLDSTDALVAKDNECFLEAVDDIGSTAPECFEASEVSFELATPKADVLSICSASGKAASVINARNGTASITATLPQYMARRWAAYDSNKTCRFQYNFGSKDAAGNWEAGKSGCLFFPTCTINTHVLGQTDQLVTVQIDIAAFVDGDGLGEVYLSMV